MPKVLETLKALGRARFVANMDRRDGLASSG
jgi:hypothetical protein